MSCVSMVLGCSYFYIHVLMRLRNTKTFGALCFGPRRAAQSRIHRSLEVAARAGIAAVNVGRRACDEELRVCGRARGAHRRASDES